eukprot:Pgem_evm1s304
MSDFKILCENIVETVNLNHHLKDEHVSILVEVIKNALLLNNKIKVFHVCTGNFNNCLDKTIVKILKTNFLHTLKLDDIGLDDKEVEKIANILQTNNSISTLSLNDNSIHDEGAIYLMRIELDLSDNLIDEIGILEISDALKINNTLMSISIGHTLYDADVHLVLITRFSIKTLEALSNAIKENSLIFELVLFGFKNDKWAYHIRDLLNSNKNKLLQLIDNVDENLHLLLALDFAVNKLKLIDEKSTKQRDYILKNSTSNSSSR